MRPRKRKAHAAKRYVPEAGKSFLAEWREARGVRQREMAKAVGISTRQYARIERGEIDDPGVRVLHNCAIALGVELYDILPPEWFHWTTFSKDADAPPKWEKFFHFNRKGAEPDLKVWPSHHLNDYLPTGWFDERVRELMELRRTLRADQRRQEK